MEGLALLAIVGATALSFAVSQKWRTRFQRATRAVGLEPKGWESRAAGHLRGFPVEVRLEGSDGRWLTVIEVGGLPSDVSMVADPGAGRIGRALRRGLAAELEIGDPRFDGGFRVRGDERKLRAALDAGARAFACKLSEEVTALRLEGGSLEVRAPGYLAEAHALRVRVNAVLSLAEAMFRGAGPTERLYTNAFGDPLPRVREHSLRVLLDQAEHARRLEAIAEAMEHDQPELRLLAARAAGSSAWPVMAELGQSRLLDPALRRQAIESLPASTPREVRIDVALSAVGKPDTSLAAAAARLAGRSAEPGDLRVESALLALLSRPDDEARFAAISALGRVGTARAVEQLLPFTEGLLTPGGVKHRARTAVRAIQARLTHGEAGAISLAGADPLSGAMSLVDEAAGALSLLATDP